MSQYVEGPTRTFTAGGALAPFLRVYITGGKLAAAGATTVEIGTVEREAYAANDEIAVRLRTAEGTCKMVASGEITSGAAVYAAASGKIAATGTVFCGNALESATADGDVIEVLRGPNTDISAATTGTTATSFTVDSDGNTAKIALSTNSATGDYTATVVPPNLTGNATITLPAATATLASLAGTETLTNKTLTAPVITWNTAAVAAAGADQTNAAALTIGVLNVVSAADGTKCVILPAAAGGGWCEVYSSVATAGLPVFPAVGDDINDGTANAAVTIEGKSMARFVAADNATWCAMYTANS